MKKIIVLIGCIMLGGILWEVFAKPGTPETQRVSSKLDGLAVATFAGGCFWCVESGFQDVPGVHEAISGYSGGTEPDPTYQSVARGRTGHTEAVQVYYDPKLVTYEGLLQAFWRMMDPTDSTGQFSDRGKQYRPAIFFHDDAQKLAAIKSSQALDKSGPFSQPVSIEITPFMSFHKAENYHQDYSQKNPFRYAFYTSGSGRADFVRDTWGSKLKVDFSKYQPKTEKYKKPSVSELKKNLTKLQYEVTQEEGTERPFSNEYWDNKREGIYVDIVSGEPLFSSKDKYKSGTGWPSFTKPLVEKNISRKEDHQLFSTRIEIRSKHGDSHLGHVFNDGPAPTGKRYCMNSASLRFVPKEDLGKEGYEEFKAAFKIINK